MSRYYFHIDGHTPYQDSVGEVFERDEQAWSAALRLMRDVETGLEPGHDWRLEVCREHVPIYMIALSSRHIRP